MIHPIYDDPLLWLRPFPAEPRNLLEKHWHEIAISFIFYQVLYYLSAPICAYIFGSHYTHEISKKQRINFDIHVVALVQSFISILLTLPLFKDPMWKEDPIFGHTPFSNLVSALTAGYFIWDSIVCIQHFKMFGLGFLLHAFAALYVFMMAFKPFCQPWIPAYLIFELSTPFVNINWFIARLPDGYVSTKFTVINGLLLMVTFFSVRIVWGLYAVVQTFADYWPIRDQVPGWLALPIFALNLLLDVLNMYWFYKMVLIAKKKFKKSKSNDEKLKKSK
ncbi:hypothetical protein PP7435_CHR2-0167 [Komagataella phaffii CBS 7435]|uniref:TLC domain-containing protein n=2 Tax=Komagataella phaffii TaxID=460519 RepID=C4R2P0_KOMPG|nr:uncharacterized protein PAS_chr2-2_0161 [Komagataella phaffii GS115]AOA62842.1 GQ67_01183T0 [Komagataella phaffii]CAH2447681.1 hypothetical protein BQ9382_C2-0930 [Komagataella phaffii CBS 7435]AOA67964.1 GQ68_00206T0 [Komagataella phaffii GS115]CAY69764.1 Putative protein of unknown function [Komagataella phaffii GS115]CCA37864.1 hypothetical protein PP7435_CHR2-0167 [Komagataella phaffii CBS 7435]